MRDETANVADLKDVIRRFNEERDWLKFHDAKNVAEAISVEASELLECFMWMTREEVQARMERDAAYRERVEDELADVIAFSLCFALNSNIDVTKALLRKVAKNAAKYPVEKALGVRKKYSEL